MHLIKSGSIHYKYHKRLQFLKAALLVNGVSILIFSTFSRMTEKGDDFDEKIITLKLLIIPKHDYACFE